MKIRSASLLLPILLCLGLAAATPAFAGPLKSISSGLKKVGNALSPWKKSEPAPAPAPTTKPVKAASKPTSKAAPAKAKTKPSVAVQKKKTTSSSTASAKKKSTAAAAAVTTGAAGATGPETPDDSSSAAAANAPENAPANDTPPAAVETAAAPVPLAELPFGTPIMGKKGHVRSPFAPEDGLVDVTGIAAGTKVKCPFSGKVFRVP